MERARTQPHMEPQVPGYLERARTAPQCPGYMEPGRPQTDAGPADAGVGLLSQAAPAGVDQAPVDALDPCGLVESVASDDPAETNLQHYHRLCEYEALVSGEFTETRSLADCIHGEVFFDDTEKTGWLFGTI